MLAGHARLAAARSIGMEEVPAIRVTHLSEIECRAFMIADNKFGLNAYWDFELLAGELKELVDVGFDTIATGFSVAEVDLTLCSAEEAKAQTVRLAAENIIPEPPASPVTRRGDLWKLGRHKLLCGDARDPLAYKSLLEDERANIVFTDPPYNLPIARPCQRPRQEGAREFRDGLRRNVSAGIHGIPRTNSCTCRTSLP